MAHAPRFMNAALSLSESFTSLDIFLVSLIGGAFFSVCASLIFPGLAKVLVVWAWRNSLRGDSLLRRSGLYSQVWGIVSAPWCLLFLVLWISRQLSSSGFAISLFLVSVMRLFSTIDWASLNSTGIQWLQENAGSGKPRLSRLTVLEKKRVKSLFKRMGEVTLERSIKFDVRPTLFASVLLLGLFPKVPEAAFLYGFASHSLVSSLFRLTQTRWQIFGESLVMAAGTGWVCTLFSTHVSSVLLSLGAFWLLLSLYLNRRSGLSRSYATRHLGVEASLLSPEKLKKSLEYLEIGVPLGLKIPVSGGEMGGRYASQMRHFFQLWDLGLALVIVTVLRLSPARLWLFGQFSNLPS